MKLSTAIAQRTSELLRERKMSQYRLEKITAIPHTTMQTIMSERYDSLNFRTIMQIIRGLDMTAAEFFDDPIFDDPELEID